MKARYTVECQGIEFFRSFESGWLPCVIRKVSPSTGRYVIKCRGKIYKVTESQLGETHENLERRKSLLLTKTNIQARQVSYSQAQNLADLHAALTPPYNTYPLPLPEAE